MPKRTAPARSFFSGPGCPSNGPSRISQAQKRDGPESFPARRVGTTERVGVPKTVVPGKSGELLQKILAFICVRVQGRLVFYTAWQL